LQASSTVADDPALAFVQVLQDVEFQLGEIGFASSPWKISPSW
jgi:hypothetical protein